MTATLEATLTVERLGPHFGAVVHDLDLRRLSDEQVSEIRRTWIEHKLLFFTGQQLTDADQVAFANRLGRTTVGHPVARSEVSEQVPEIFDIDSSDPEFHFSDVWHTDVSFMKSPPLGSILRSVQLPPSGGNTNWVDSQAAFDSLSAPFQRYLEQLNAVHDGNRSWGEYLRRHGGRGNVWDGEPVTSLPSVEHPVVRVHPETGRKGLFVNPGFTSHIAGVSTAESRGILDILYAHLVKPEHLISHRWSVGDVGLWDNRATLHYANADYDDTRIMRRVTLAGDQPFGVSDLAG